MISSVSKHGRGRSVFVGVFQEKLIQPEMQQHRIELLFTAPSSTLMEVLPLVPEGERRSGSTAQLITACLLPVAVHTRTAKLICIGTRVNFGSHALFRAVATSCQSRS